MSDVIHRTERDSNGCLLHRRSVNTPDYPAKLWVVNPDLASLAGVARCHWKVVDGAVIEMGQTEKDAVAAVRVAKNTRVENDRGDRYRPKFHDGGDTAPGTGDDVAAGWRRGDHWKTSTGLWLCFDDSEGEAVWISIGTPRRSEPQTIEAGRPSSV